MKSILEVQKTNEFFKNKIVKNARKENKKTKVFKKNWKEGFSGVFESGERIIPKLKLFQIVPNQIQI
jgi:hypothetical protein